MSSSRHHRTSASTIRQGQPDSRSSVDEGKVDSLLVALREAITESGWKHAALAVVLQLPNAAYLSRMLTGEKPWTLRHLALLPDDIEAIFSRKHTEQFGHIVVAPLSGLDAQKALVAGLIGLMSQPQLPARADHMVRAELPAKKVAVNE